MVRVTFFILLFIGSFCTCSFAQSFSIQGTIIDEQQNPVAYANVVLLNFSDSSFIQGAVSDSVGYFSFQRIASQHYFIKVQYIGYETYYSEPFENNTESIQITLKASVATLGEVSITATKPFIEQHLDKMVVNVENSPASGGNTALELLEKSPGVTVDHNTESIRMLNKQGVIFYINGRQSYMSGTDLMQYLRTLQAEQISRIEIITNPSSKYDAAGNAGIINIVLKKDKSQGTNGNIVLGAGKGFLPDSRTDLYRGSMTASINHRTKKIYVYSVTSLLRDALYNERNINRSFYFNNIESVFDQQMRINQNFENINLKSGIDYFISEKTTAGIGIDMNLFRLKVNGTNSTDALMNPMIDDENFSIEQHAKQYNPRSNINTNFNLKHNFNDKGHALTFDADYLNYNFRSEQDFDADFFDAFNNSINNLLQSGLNTSRLNVIAGKLDYELPINEKTKIEAGIKSSYVNINSILNFKEMINQVWVLDTTKSNHFIYSENINALYGNFQKEFSKFSVQLGIRAEHTSTQGKSVTLNNTVNRSYLSLFPSFFTTYKINNNHSLKLSYSRRLDRPGYDQLNPFIIVLDPYSYATGNPYLQPQFTNAIELGYRFKTYSLTFNYSRTDKLITELTIPDDSTKITRTLNTNVNYVDNFSTTFFISQSVKKVWHINAQMILFYKHFSDNNLLGGQLNASRWMYYMNLTNNFVLPKKWGIELSGWYMSPFVEGIIVGKNHRFSVNAGIQKTFMKDKAKIKLNMSDIFLTSFIEGYVDYQNVHLTFNPRHTSRRLILTFSYNFGSQTVKTNQRNKSAADSEKERIAK